jgi:hypothetical protein
MLLIVVLNRLSPKTFTLGELTLYSLEHFFFLEMITT